MTLVVRFPDSLRPEREYAAHVVLDVHLGLPYRVVFESRADVQIHAEGVPAPALIVPDLVFSAGEPGWPGLAVRPDERAEDVFGTTFWYLTRLEEIISSARDGHQRFPAAASADTNQTPYVDELIDRFGLRLLGLWPQLRLRRHDFDCAPTHDVDRPFKHLFQRPGRLLRAMARDALRRRDLGAAVRAPLVQWAVRRGRLERDPFNTFEWLMDQSEAVGLRSTFYFICTAGTGGVDGDYRLQDAPIRALLRRIHARKHAIGLHGSYASAFDSDVLRREVQILRRTCEEEGIQLDRVRARQHVLRYDPRSTPGVWARAGVDEDSTLGHAALAGFRCGTCRAFPLFDTVSRTMTSVIEKPLIAMDASLLEPRYENLPHPQALARIETLAQRCREARGSFVFLWHNCQLEDSQSRALYTSALRAVAQA